MSTPDGTDQHRQVPTEDLPADIRQALTDYDQAWAAHRFGAGKWADDYPGQAAQDQAIAAYVSSHVPTEV